MFKLSNRSLSKLEGLHEDLSNVVKRAIELTPIDFGVSEGIRSLETQREYLEKGVSTTMRSRHLTGHAVDVYAYVAGMARWEMPLYKQISEAFFKAAQELGVDIEWGGDWKKFKDGPHFQLSWLAYPDDEPVT
jgi:peptidoglycan L-alanyl-D-glutamate endopeptidase CwlK